MSIEVRFSIAFVAGFFVACTKPNPEFCKEMPNDPICNPPAVDATPDVPADAVADSAPDAFTCTTGAFEMCQDPGTALVCNADGTAFAPMTCPNGCNTTFGCQICTPNQTTCANDNAQTCDSQGNVSSDELCTLGCAGTTRCKTLVPSNNLGMFFTMTPNPQDLTLAGTLDLTTGKLTSGGVTTTLPSFNVAAPTGGAPIQVFVGKNVSLGDLIVVAPNLGPAFAVLATNDLKVTGRVSVASGAVDIVGCTGGFGGVNGDFLAGHGGGGNATAGAHGGSVPGQAAVGGSGGAVSGSSTLVPLRGGCPGRISGLGSGPFGGGGAIQLVSLTSITITGTVVADATFNSSNLLVSGGAGGGILIESPTVVLSPGAKLLARGGGGSAGTTLVPTPPDDATAPLGSICNPPNVHCGSGGNGAAVNVAATAGADTATASADTFDWIGGGGGGGLGRIRINTKDGNFTLSSSAILAGDLTTGVVGSN